MNRNELGNRIYDSHSKLASTAKSPYNMRRQGKSSYNSKLNILNQGSSN